MYNNDVPLGADLPSSGRLLRSTVIAAISAAVLLTIVVLPAEYGIDPTGVGRFLRLTEMGEIKMRLTAEDAADSKVAVTVASTPAPPVASTIAQAASVSAATSGSNTASPAPAAAAAAAAINRRDELSFTLAPGEGTEVKMRMKEGEKAFYVWAVEGGVVNYDTHGDDGGRSLSYVKGRAISTDQGELTAAFTGSHGWYWRNRGAAGVKLVLRTRGTYSDIQRMK